MGEFTILQRTSDGYFDANALLNQWKSKNKTCKDTFNDFLSQKKVQEFMLYLEQDMGNKAIPQKWGMANSTSIKVIKGRNTSMRKLYGEKYQKF